MPILQLHQYRVAAAAKQVCESLDISVDTQSIVAACLLHDMGNIIKFQLNYFPEANEPEGIEYWQKIQEEYFAKYGTDEHHATLEILKELNVSSYVYDLVYNIDSVRVEDIASGDDFGKKICIYFDNRVTPHGIVTVDERTREAKERYKTHPHAFDEEKRALFVKNIFDIENHIFSHSSIKPEDITDESVKDIIEELKSFSLAI
jgi:hypothetical protein